MNTKRAFDRGLIAGLLLMLGGQAIYWFITPMSHPDAGSTQTALVALQCLVGLGGGAWLLRWRAGLSEGVV